MSRWQSNMEKLTRLQQGKATHKTQSHETQEAGNAKTPENGKAGINRAMAAIWRAGGVIKPDGSGLSFPGGIPGTPEERAATAAAALEAWAAYMGIRPLLFKDIRLFPLGGLMVRARFYNGVISILWPDGLTKEERQTGEEILREYPLSRTDFL